MWWQHWWIDEWDSIGVESPTKEWPNSCRGVFLHLSLDDLSLTHLIPLATCHGPSHWACGLWYFGTRPALERAASMSENLCKRDPEVADANENTAVLMILEYLYIYIYIIFFVVCVSNWKFVFSCHGSKVQAPGLSSRYVQPLQDAPWVSTWDLYQAKPIYIRSCWRVAVLKMVCLGTKHLPAPCFSSASRSASQLKKAWWIMHPMCYTATHRVLGMCYS